MLNWHWPLGEGPGVRWEGLPPEQCESTRKAKEPNRSSQWKQRFPSAC